MVFAELLTTSGSTSDRDGHFWNCAQETTQSMFANFLHDRPRNNGQPPSPNLERCLAAAADKRPDPVEQRVRFHLCASVTKMGLQRSLIDFACLEMDACGTNCLTIRRGSAILTSMRLRNLRAVRTGMFIKLTARAESKQSQPEVFLSFEDEARIEKFCSMCRNASDTMLEE